MTTHEYSPAKVFMTVDGLSPNIYPTWVGLYDQYGALRRYDLNGKHENVVRENGDGYYLVTYDPAAKGVGYAYPFIDSIEPVPQEVVDGRSE